MEINQISISNLKRMQSVLDKDDPNEMGAYQWLGILIMKSQSRKVSTYELNRTTIHQRTYDLLTKVAHDRLGDESIEWFVRYIGRMLDVDGKCKIKVIKVTYHDYPSIYEGLVERQYSDGRWEFVPEESIPKFCEKGE